MLLTKGKQDLEHANSTLDRYNSAINASVSYLMDIDGVTVASPTVMIRTALWEILWVSTLFPGVSQGQAGRYFAIGVTSGKRGFYASYPVRNFSGQVMGVAAIKKDGSSLF